jgi:hypothetical protein
VCADRTGLIGHIQGTGPGEERVSVCDTEGWTAEAGAPVLPWGRQAEVFIGWTVDTVEGRGW